MELDILKQNTTWNDARASINNNFAKVKTALEQGGGSGSAAVDTQMSDTSEKAVQNKVIKKYVDDEVEDAKAYSEEMADNAEKAAKKYADDNKVAKVEGKQLSTEDFTTTLKQKLDGLNNYDDAYVRSAIEELQNSLDAIVNGDATSAIDSIQEILAFLSTITDTQTLAGIVADLKQYVDDEVESVSPLYVNIGMDFPNETTTGTLPDLEISFSDILSAAEGKRDIWIVVSDGTAYQCLVTYLSENSGGIAIRAYKHEVNGANFSTIAIAFVDGSVPVWHSNHIEFQEKLVSGENLATVNGKSLLEGGNIEIEGGGITEEKEVYIGSSEPPVGTKVWIDPTGTPSQPSQPSAGTIKIYLFPSAAVETMRLEGTYTFSAEETAAFHQAYADRHNTIFMIELKGADKSIGGGICSIAEIYETGNNSYLIHFPVDSVFANIFNYEMTLENQDGLLVFYV